VEPEVIVDKLSYMSPEDIRALMVSEGVVGVQGDAGHCVVAEYLSVLGFESPAVCPMSIHVNGEHYRMGGTGFMKFVMNFDQGVYPELSVGKSAALERRELWELQQECLKEVGY
jgi:hypothetical protein